MAGTGRFHYLDGLRAVAIGSVLGVHWLVWYVPFFHGGVIGVDIFFVLSGFIITTVLWRSSSTRTLAGEWLHFVRRRVVRLYPALVGLVVGATVLYAVVPHSGLSATEVTQRGLMVLGQATSIWGAVQEGSLLVPALEPFGHTWSLAVEWYFYLAWPLLLLAVRRRGWTAQRTAHLSVVIAACCYAGSLVLPPFWFYFGPSARFAEILAGCALALYLLARPNDAAPLRMPPVLPAAALVAVVLYVLLAPASHGPYRWIGVPLAVTATLVIICAGYAASGGPVRTLLSHPLLTAIGRVSYSLYLWHTVPVLALEDVPSVPKPLLGVLAVGMVAALTVGSYSLLERPFLRGRSDVLSPRRTPTSSVPRPREVSTEKPPVSRTKETPGP
ncbi:acyltransferase family protein [Nocardioides massiliensis]|uniref:Peptidoglycan/LPS O-acetylase OafA/YrhL n=1 Tax=Nocardioides massiliensis TaxID=1325935 RepID=A0ABT9NNI3_9ACTN|nr:acyltransferase [Nocardioides massiliensis]MDP9821759.1 peptidoglycan/LPS O-acetylase OafA/YrhL [Nocardioides massiliensis]